MKINEKPIDIVIVYMPTTDHDDENIEIMYDEISEILHQEGRGQVNAIVMGEFKSTVGEGSFGLCKRKKRRKMLIKFYKQHVQNDRQNKVQ